LMIGVSVGLVILILVALAAAWVVMRKKKRAKDGLDMGEGLAPVQSEPRPGPRPLQRPPSAVGSMSGRRPGSPFYHQATPIIAITPLQGPPEAELVVSPIASVVGPPPLPATSLEVRPLLLSTGNMNTAGARPDGAQPVQERPLDAGQVRKIRQEFKTWALSDEPAPTPKELTALLEARYGRGEISKETFESLKGVIGTPSFAEII